MASPLEIYERLVVIRDDPDQFNAVVDQIWREFLEQLPDDRRLRAEQFKWAIDAQLRSIKDPIARYNKMVELFWSGVDKFQKALSC